METRGGGPGCGQAENFKGTAPHEHTRGGWGGGDGESVRADVGPAMAASTSLWSRKCLSWSHQSFPNESPGSDPERLLQRPEECSFEDGVLSRPISPLLGLLGEGPSSPKPNSGGGSCILYGQWPEILRMLLDLCLY